MALGSRRDPYLSFNFLVELEGLLVGGFNEVSGLQAEIELHDYREGGLNDYIHRLPGPVRYPVNLVLKRGITDNQPLWLWYCDVRRGVIARRNLTIILRDNAGMLAYHWHLERAYPVRWIGPALRADSNTVAVETLELVHCGISTL
jgi:phage tail-like protein